MSNQQQTGQQVAVAPQRAPLAIQQGVHQRSMFALGTFDEAYRFANAMANMNQGVRKHLRGQPEMCLMVTMQALETGVSPLALANKSYVVNDQLAYESAVYAGLVITSGVIDGEMIEYSWEGEPFTTRRCTTTMKLRSSGRVITYTTPETQKIKPKNSPLWQTDEDRQLGYYAVRAAARLHFPHVLLGFVAVDDVLETPDPSEPKPPKPTTQQALDRLAGPAAEPQQTEPAAEEKPKRAQRKATEQKAAEKQPAAAVTPANVMQQPLVQDTLKQFPGAQVVDVRANETDAPGMAEVWGDEEEVTGAQPAAAGAGVENAPWDEDEGGDDDGPEVDPEVERIQIRMGELDHVPTGIDKDDILQCRQYLAGLDAAMKGMPRRSIPSEIACEERAPEGRAWLRGHDKVTGFVKPPKPKA